MRILVVDDNEEAAQSLRDLLQLAGYDVIATTLPSTALTEAQAFVPDVAILDIELGVINGYELGQHLRAIRGLGGLTLIAVTGYNEQDTHTRSRKAGFEYHLVKPIETDRLHGILRKLASKEARDLPRA